MLEEEKVDFDINKYERIREIFQKAALKFCLLATEVFSRSSGLKGGEASRGRFFQVLPLLGSSDPICN